MKEKLMMILKTLTETKRKNIDINVIEEKEDKEKRVLTFIGTDETKDRVNEILTSDGWDSKNFKKNPVFLWAHNKSELPIGKTITLRKSEDKKIFKVEFVPADIYPFADTVYRMYKAGFLNAVSVGYIPDIKSMEWDEKTETLITRKKELLELSAVPVGCNPNALQQRDIEDMYSKGLTEKDIVLFKKNFDQKQKDDNENLKSIIKDIVKEVINENNKTNIFDELLSGPGNTNGSKDDGLSEIINKFKSSYMEVTK